MNGRCTTARLVTLHPDLVTDRPDGLSPTWSLSSPAWSVHARTTRPEACRHYTRPGDVVLDGFCGSGMTGVAAQWCGSAPSMYRLEIEQQWRSEGRGAPEWGPRRVVLGDLSPAATFIAANYNLPFDVPAFCEAAARLLKEVEGEVGWMYETLHTDGKTKGRINYTVWSEVFSCPECAGEVVFLSEALARLRLRPTRHVVPFLGARASCPLEHRGPAARCGRDARAPRSASRKTWLNCKDDGGSRCLARLRLRPTRHVVPFPGARASCPLEHRGPAARCGRDARAPRSASRKTWLNCKDDGGSRCLARLRLRPTRHVVPFPGARASCPLEHRGPAARCGRMTVLLSAAGR